LGATVTILLCITVIVVTFRFNLFATIWGFADRESAT